METYPFDQRLSKKAQSIYKHAITHHVIPISIVCCTLLCISVLMTKNPISAAAALVIALAAFLTDSLQATAAKNAANNLYEASEKEFDMSVSIHDERISCSINSGKNNLYSNLFFLSDLTFAAKGKDDNGQDLLVLCFQDRILLPVKNLPVETQKHLIREGRKNSPSRYKIYIAADIVFCAHTLLNIAAALVK